MTYWDPMNGVTFIWAHEGIITHVWKPTPGDLPPNLRPGQVVTPTGGMENYGGTAHSTMRRSPPANTYPAQQSRIGPPTGAMTSQTTTSIIPRPPRSTSLPPSAHVTPTPTRLRTPPYNYRHRGGQAHPHGPHGECLPRHRAPSPPTTEPFLALPWYDQPSHPLPHPPL